LYSTKKLAENVCGFGTEAETRNMKAKEWNLTTIVDYQNKNIWNQGFNKIKPLLHGLISKEHKGPL
jgi:hypothetical protein